MKKCFIIIGVVGSILLSNSVIAQSEKNQPELSNGGAIVSEKYESEKGTNVQVTSSSSISVEESKKKKEEKGVANEKSSAPALGNSGIKVDVNGVSEIKE